MNDNNNYRKNLPNSKFHLPVYDTCIVGINVLTKSIMYHKEMLIGMDMKLRKDEFAGNPNSEGIEDISKWNDFYDSCLNSVVHTFVQFQEKPEEGMVAPTLFKDIGAFNY